MQEKHSYPHGRIARLVEQLAGKTFGPEDLTKDVVAQALHVDAEQISDVEWEEISEFAVNAGSALIRSSIDAGRPVETEEEYQAARTRIKEFSKGLIPFHDIFHAAETYRLTQGASASAEFAKVGIRERYTDPTSAAAELYPVLFLIIPPNLNEPFPILLSHQEGREAIASFLETSFDASSPQVKSMIDRLENTNQPADIDGRKKEYEALVELIVVHNAMVKLEDGIPDEMPLTEHEAQAIHLVMQQAAADSSSHYYQFATKVFSQTEPDPRLFLDEFLACIRTMPGQQAGNQR